MAPNTTTTTRDDNAATELTDDMAELKARTESGTIDGTVKKIWGDSFGDYCVRVETDFETVRRDFDKPSAWTYDYAFVRWVEGNGYTAENFDRMVADNATVPVDASPDGLELEVSHRTLRHKASGVAGGVWGAFRGTDPVLQSWGGAVVFFALMVLLLPVNPAASSVAFVLTVLCIAIAVLNIIATALEA